MNLKLCWALALLDVFWVLIDQATTSPNPKYLHVVCRDCQMSSTPTGPLENGLLFPDLA